MDRAGKRGRISKKRKVIILAVAITGVGLASLGIYSLQGMRGKRAAAQEIPVQEVQAEIGNISNTIVGTGNLECGEGTSITIPSGIVVDEVKAESGERVSKGDVLAVVNQTSVLRAMEDIQEEIEDLDEEIDDSKDGTDTQYVKSKVDARVKKIYVQEGQEISECMGAQGALIILSMEDYVDVEDEADAEIAVTATSGQVEEICVSEGDLVYTGSTLLKIENDGQSLEFREQMAERQELAERLQKLTALSQSGVVTAEEDGIISSVNISADGDMEDAESTQVSQNAVAMGSTQMSRNAVALGNAQVSQNAVAVAGNVQVTRNAVALGNAQASRNAVALASVQDTQGTSGAEEGGSGSGDEENQGICLALQVADSGISSQKLLVVETPETGGTPQTALRAEDGSYEGVISWKPECKKFEAKTSYQACVSLTSGDGYFFGQESISEVKTGVLSGVSVTEDGKKMSFYITYPFTEEEKEDTGNGTGNGEGDNVGNGTGSGEGDKVGNGTGNGEGNNVGNGTGNGGGNNVGNGAGSGENSTGSEEGNNGGNGAGNGAGSNSGNEAGNGEGNNGGAIAAGDVNGTVKPSASGANSGTAGSVSASQVSTAVSGSDSQDSSAQSSDSDSEVAAFTMCSADCMILSVNVDELDINSVSAGQEAEIVLDAIEGETFTGTVTKVGNSASSSSGGVAKYTVKVEIPGDERMKEGMNASATITIEERENVVTIPVNALQERGNQVFVYTQSDNEGGLSGELAVTTGLSDGDIVEITEGLSKGDTVYYQKRGNVSGQEGFQKFGEMGGPGGDMGDMPRGDFKGGEFGGGMPEGGMPGGQQ